jgi:CRP-like cAMP-binding protein
MTEPAELHPEHNRLIRKLDCIFTLTSEEKQAVFALPLTTKTLLADTDIVRDGDRPSECCLIVEGLVCRYKLTPEGKRQIHSFHIPGDIPDLQSLHLKVMDHSLGTLSRSKVAFIPHQSVRDLTRAWPRIADAFWRDTLIDAAIFREWMVGIGRRSAHQRIAHVICEMLVKSKAVGLANDNAFHWPVTQSEIGDALGLSTVHVNRVLQDLRKDGLLVFERGEVSIPNWEALKEAGEFDPTYLHLDREEDAA